MTRVEFVTVVVDLDFQKRVLVLEMWQCYKGDQKDLFELCRLFFYGSDGDDHAQ